MTIRLPPAVIRLGAREIGRRVLNPALPWEVQRRRLDRLVGSWPLPRGTSVTRTALGEAAGGPVIVSGDSAGGGLALTALLARPGSGDSAAGLASGVAGCILLSPWLDLAADRGATAELVRRDVLLSPDWLEACASAYVPTADLTDPSVSPLQAELGGLPPLLIQSGADDLLAPDAERLAVRASAAGVDVTYTRWPGLWHDFALQPDLVAAADSALSQASWFVARLTR